MPGPADRLLELMYEWMDEALECSSNLRGLARELESLRENCNAVETFSSTVAAAGTVLSILAAPFTGGTSLLVGAAVGGLGAGVSVVTKLIEKFESSDKLKRVQAINKRCVKIVLDMQNHYETLSEECPSRSRDKRDKHVVKEFLKAMLRQMDISGRLDIKDLNRFVRDLMEDLLFRKFRGSALDLLVIEVIGVLTLFSLKLGGSMLPAIAAAGGIQIGKVVLGAGASAAFLGLVGLGINLFESISSWRELIKNKHETDASRSLRDTAKKIEKARTDLSDKLSKIRKMLREALKEHSRKRELHPDVPSLSEEESSCDSDDSQTRYQSGMELPRYGVPYVPRHERHFTSQMNNRSVRAKTTKTTPSNKSKGSKSGNSSRHIAWSKSSSSSRHQDQESSSESYKSQSCSDSESESRSSKVEVELKMALVNARSINKFVLRKDRALIELLQGNHLDLLLVTETWLKMESLSNDALSGILPPNYNILSAPRGHGRGGGVAIVHRHVLKCERIHFEFMVTFEYVATAVTPPGCSEPLLVLNIYRPPGGSTTEFGRDFLVEFNLLMCDVHARFKTVVVGGDFNVWVDRPDRKARVFEEITRENDLVQHVSQFTHSGGHTLDLVFTRSDVRVDELSVQNNSFSDHRTVVFRAKLRLKKSKRKHFRKME